tara:strand:+ start:213 stop:1109 length:897 start_codon:yes stop_codon:yes gene_type:complete
MLDIYGKKMKITVIGAGAIGIVLAASLDNKNEVSVLVKPENYKRLIKKGLWIIEGNKKRKIKAKIVTEVIDSEIVLIAVKGYDLQNTKKLLDSFTGKVIICQNGLKMLDFRLSNDNEIYSIVTSIGATSSEIGVSEFKGTGKTVVGGLFNVKKDSKEILELFSSYFFDISQSKDIKKEIWLKAAINSAINPIASFHNLKNGELKKSEYWTQVKELLTESVSIAKSNGIKFRNDPIDLTEEIIEKTADNLCSMLQDIKKGRKTEINEINGILCQMGKKQNIIPKLNLEYLKKIKTLVDT